MQVCLPLYPLSDDCAPQARAALFATLARIDGWGQGAWREVLGAWRISAGTLAIDELEAGVSRDSDDRVVSLTLILDVPGLAGAPADADATCDWVLRRLWQTLMPTLSVVATTYQPGPTIERTNACVLVKPPAGTSTVLLLRLLVRLPMAGMCCDGRMMARSLRQIEAYARGLTRSGRYPGLARHRRCVRIQRALRAALPAHGLVGFVAQGSRLARDRDDEPAVAGAAIQLARVACTTIDLGSLGRYQGLGIRQGVTAIAGAPYHGKSTLLQALISGSRDHRPGDGRELVVTNSSVLCVQADDGRRIKRLDLTTFFRSLPGGEAADFSSDRASGATSMAASLLQGISAGCRLLAIDEDTAASNFLSIDDTMRRLLGGALRGTTTLLELLPHLSRLGVSTLLVAGANAETLRVSDQVVMMRDFMPHDLTSRVRRLLARPRIRIGRSRDPILPLRILEDDPDCLFGPRHFLDVDATQPDRPVVARTVLDLRRSGWQLDAATVRGALAAAAWACRLAEGQAMDLNQVRERYEGFIATHGARGLDPFATALMTVPPWQLVVSVLERLPRPLMHSRAAAGGLGGLLTRPSGRRRR